MSLLVNGIEYDSFHFVGILGIGMSAIAQFLVKDCSVTGSDRGCGGEAVAFVEQSLRSLGCEIFSQDGSGITTQTGALVVSTAIESSNPDICRAKEFDVPVLHRSEVLAAIVNSYKTISVTGTSGKSSVSAMIFHTLLENDIDASYIGGANLHSLREKGMIGNGYRGTSDILVIEADESDGTVVRYHPEISVLLNISRDHKEEREVQDLLTTAAAQSAIVVKNGDDSFLSEITGTTFGFDSSSDFYPTSHTGKSTGVMAMIQGVEFEIPFPGEHTVANTLAVTAALSHLNISVASVAFALRSYRGIERRFDIYRVSDTVTVIDDYAHNPEKIAAAIRAAQQVSSQVTAVFQPHGFGPLKFMFDDLVHMFQTVQRESDRLYLMPVYFAGGTVDRSVDSTLLSQSLGNCPVVARNDLPEYLRRTCRDPEAILLLGARDPSLSLLAQEIRNCIKGEMHE